MQLNKSFLAIGNGITDICDSRVAFATEKGVYITNIVVEIIEVRFSSL